MFWSDSTHLANFGTAKVWPLYLYFGNLSKYIHGKPNSNACHHVAYIPSVSPLHYTLVCYITLTLRQIPDNIQDFILSFTKISASQKPALLTHCRRELMHQVWKLLLDDEFLEAYKHGIVIQCADGVTRRVYPRIFTYSADYPEKYVQADKYCFMLLTFFRVLLATVRDRGCCPCPRCQASKKDFDQMGLVRDLRARITKARVYFSDKITRARDFIYELGKPIAGTAVERLLKVQSLVPTPVCILLWLGPEIDDNYRMPLRRSSAH